MIKKATVKPNTNSIMQLPPPLVVNMANVKKPKVKPKYDFDFCLKELQKNFDASEEVHEDYISGQQKTMKGLLQLLENKQVGTYLLNKFKNSRFKSYKMAIRTFSNMIDGYFDGSVEMSNISAYQDTIPTTAGEHWYEEFNDFRINFINGLRNINRENSFAKCIEILSEAETHPYSDNENYPYDKWLSENMKVNKKYIIDLMEMVWPDKGGTLKLLFGG